MSISLNYIMNTKKTQTDLGSSSTRKWNNLKKKIKTELEIIYLSTDDKKFLNINDAISHQGTINIKDEIKMEEEKMIVDVKHLIVEVLKKNDWGVFFKGEPITSLPVQDNDKIYKVNEVAVDKLLDSIDDFIGENKEDEWKRRNQQD